MTKKDLYNEVRDKYGTRHQVMIAIEELSELQKELCKALRGENTIPVHRIAEEIADVEIMLEQLKMIYRVEEESTTWKEQKLIRLVGTLRDVEVVEL